MRLQDLLYKIYVRLPLDPKRRVYRLEVEAKEIELLTIKDFIQRVCDAAGCGTKEIANVKLAVDEACSNIVRHAYKDREVGRIVLEIGVGYGDLKIKIIDFGKPFDFHSVKDPDLNRYVDIGRKGGLGIWLIKKMMNDVQYRSFPDRNELILYRRLSKAPPKELGIKKGSYSVSAKFTLGSVVLIFTLILLAYFLIGQRQQSQVYQQQYENVTTILQAVSAEAGIFVAHKSDLELDRLIHEVLRSDKFKVLSYAFVVGSDGKYLAHSDLNQVFKTYQPMTGIQGVKQPGVEVFHPAAGLSEYVAPVFYKGQWMGEVHIGVSDRALQVVVVRAKADLQKLLLLIVVVSVIGLYFLSRIFIKPFQRILEGVTAMNQGDFNVKIQVDSQDEFGQLAGIFNEMTAKIQDSQKGMMEQERIQKEMQVAQEIQHTLLPGEFPQIEGYEIGATYRAAKEVGGDYYDFFWVDPTTMGIVVADVSGKGVPGSLVMTMIRTAMRLEARGNKSASDVLAKVNQHVTNDMKKGMFVTMFYIILDSRDRSINFASAGHNPMILFRGKTQEVYFLKPKGFPVGIDLPEEDMFVKNLALQKVSLEKDDILVIYTDGITEAMNPEKEQFGEERLINVIKENFKLTPAEFVEKLNEAIAQFTRGAEQNDDITVVAIKEKMKVDQVQFKFRKKLLDLVEKKGVSVAEACRQMNTSTNTYYRLKKIFDEQGKSGLKSAKRKKRVELRELSLIQQQAVMAVIKRNPGFGPPKIAEALRKGESPLKVESRFISEFLERKGLSDFKARLAISDAPGAELLALEEERSKPPVRRKKKRPRKKKAVALAEPAVMGGADAVLRSPEPSSGPGKAAPVEPGPGPVGDVDSVRPESNNETP
ncbi:MAG TPA: SpoIIE family protein phosphatase [bacterium]|nr:SpoIIE family protein phosphatase [bacterium]